MIELAEDFRDLLLELHDAGAAFAVVGGPAVAYHGHPRATKHLDVLVRPDQENAERVYRALDPFFVSAARGQRQLPACMRAFYAFQSAPPGESRRCVEIRKCGRYSATSPVTSWGTKVTRPYD